MGWLDGSPLKPLEATIVAAIWWVWACRRSLPGTRAIAVLAVVKIVLGGLLVDRGFEGRYFANDSWTPLVERSTEFPNAPFIVFGMGPPDLPLYFFNDNRRFEQPGT